MRQAVALLIALLVLADLGWNLRHFNVGLSDILALVAFARGFVENGAWPATPYFPAGYPLLLSLGGLAGNALVAGYVYSAAGLALTLWALYRLLREFNLPRWVGLVAILLAWAMPVYRLPAGSPSVDALFTGLGLWFIGAAIALWRRSGALPETEPGEDPGQPGTGLSAVSARLPQWAALGLIVPVIALPLLRYHAVVLILPVLVLLGLLRRRARPAVAWPGVILVAVFLFNYASWYAAYGGWMPSVVGIQMRCGLEFSYHINYENPEYLCADYIALAERSREVSVAEDYGWPLVIRHTITAWYHYLRRPPVVLALGLGLLMLLLRRRLPPGAVILGLWIPMYCLALSPAYYTPRGALLPAMAAVGLALVLCAHLVTGRLAWLATVGAAALLLLGYSQANRYSKLVYEERLHFAGLSREFDRELREHGWSNDQVIVTDVRVIPLRDNPWGTPFPHTEMFWSDDPAVRKSQTPGIVQISIEETAQGPPGYKAVLFKTRHPRYEEMSAIIDSPVWRPTDELEEMVLLERAE